MRATRDHLLGLIQLARVQQSDERRALWRQSMATLAAAIETQHALPLEGLDPDALAESVKSVLETKLIEDVGFLSAPAANAALYELAAALPMGNERRELGRIVLKNLHQGDAHTFVALRRRSRSARGALSRARRFARASHWRSTCRSVSTRARMRSRSPSSRGATWSASGSRLRRPERCLPGDSRRGSSSAQRGKRAGVQRKATTAGSASSTSRAS
jgi:hypothetical protein